MAQINQERIANLVQLNNDEVDDLIKSSNRSQNWSIAVDYMIPDGIVDGEPAPLDQGTKYITLDRVGLLTDTRTVPQTMLPHQMDIILDGEMAQPIPGSSVKWTFTDDRGNKYVCPKPTEPDEILPDINTIYRDRQDPDHDGNYIYTQYRYVPDDNAYVGTPDETGHFVPIPSDLLMVNGNGTVVTDDMESYTRQVDVVIGAPCAETGTSNSILIDGEGKLVHASTSVTPGKYPASEPAALSFGGTFNISSFTVNTTGHVTNATTTSVIIPSTAAGTNTAGLVKIGAAADIRNIGSTKSAGTVTPNPYVKVAAADHVHAASTLTLSNINDSNFTNETLTFNGSADKTYDFWNILKAYLPSTGPGAANQLLVSTGTTAANRRATWASADSVLVPDYAIADLVEGTAGSSSASTVSLNTTSATHGGAVDVTQTAVTGLKEGKTYVVCFYFAFTHSSATASMEDVSVVVEAGNSGSSWVQVANPKYVIDGSLSGIPNCVNGSAVFAVPASKNSVRIRLRTGSSTWTVTGNIQIAEVK